VYNLILTHICWWDSHTFAKEMVVIEGECQGDLALYGQWERKTEKGT